ncbi:MAG: 2-keto-myo-inositol dehydratase [Verrucomicrobiales bacterium]|nr:2-keto-myo-inositol dehydratase [Verrucomicrobiales bacterium]
MSMENKAKESAGTERMKHIKIGIQPTGWTNDDFPEIGNDTPYQLILDQTRQTGFVGGSTGHNYPSHLQSLQHDLQSRGLGITSTWVGTQFTALGGYDATLQTVRDQITFLKAVGATDIVVAELAAAVNQVRTKSVLTDRPTFNEPQKFLLYRGLNEAGKMAADEGMRLSFHSHVGTGVQQKEETADLLANTDPKYVWFCLDSGHIQFAGDDPGVVAQTHATRIGHVHLKSVRQKVVDAATNDNYSFLRAILEGVFTVPGDPEGSVNFDPIFKALFEANYEGWIVVEAEQDPHQTDRPRSLLNYTPHTPFEYAEMARRFIRSKICL